MNIDPVDIPCVYCSGKGEKYESIEYGVEISCYSCGIKIFMDDWITGGINALVGKLLRFGIEIWESSEGWTWDSTDEEGKAWQTFEYCVLDAWEKMSMNKT